jgi:MFS transporter, DHA1 family, tetracycline resistance protein
MVDRRMKEGMRRSPLAVVFLTVFLDLVGFGIVIPLLPLYAGEFGAGPVAAAWLLALYSLMQFFFAPWWGRLSDRVGRRPVLLVGLFGSAASYLAFAFAPSLAALFAARALNGFAGANVGVAQAYVADVTPPEGRARGMGMIGAAFGLGFVFGPAIGGLLSHYGHAAPFVGAAALAAANGVVAWFRLPESLPPERRGRAARGMTLVERLRMLSGRDLGSRLKTLYAAGFLVTLAFAAMEGTFSLWADERWALSRAGVAFLFAFLGVVSVLAQGLVVGRLARRWGERRAALVGTLLFAAGLVGVALAPSLPALCVALSALALGQGTAAPSLSSLISRQGGPAEQGRRLGAYQSLGALGRVVGPVSGGVALEHLAAGAPYLLGSVLAALAALALLAAAGSVP